MDLREENIRHKPVRLTVQRKPAKSKINHTIGQEITAQLLPLKSSMRSQLAKRGFNVSHLETRSLIPLYYNEFISNKYNKESPFVPLNTYEFVNHMAFKVRPSDNLEGDVLDFKNLEQFNHLSSVVDNIVETFKLSAAKKRFAKLNGVNPRNVLTVEELDQANAVERVKKELKEKSSFESPVTQAQIMSLLKWGAIIFLIYYMIK